MAKIDISDFHGIRLYWCFKRLIERQLVINKCNACRIEIYGIQDKLLPSKHSIMSSERIYGNCWKDLPISDLTADTFCSSVEIRILGDLDRGGCQRKEYFVFFIFFRLDNGHKEKLFIPKIFEEKENWSAEILY